MGTADGSIAGVILPVREYIERKLPYVKTEYAITNHGVLLAVGNLEQARTAVELDPSITIVHRSVSEWLELD